MTKIIPKTDNLKQFLQKELRRLATKEEVKKLATKEELKFLATKEDLKPFATKEDIRPLVTKRELEEGLKPLATKKDIEDLASMTQREFMRVYERLDRIEHLILKQHELKIEDLGKRIKFLEDTFAINKK